MLFKNNSLEESPESVISLYKYSELNIEQRNLVDCVHVPANCRDIKQYEQ